MGKEMSNIFPGIYFLFKWWLWSWDDYNWPNVLES